METKEIIYGIMGAMPEEVDVLIEDMTERTPCELGGRTYHVGRLYGNPCVVVFSRWGKVAAASTATTLIQQFGVRRLLFTGVAGAVQEHLQVGDVVVADRLIQHDLDARPLIRQYEIPLLGITEVHAEPEWLEQAVERMRNGMEQAHLPAFQQNITPRLHVGLILSGDRFFADAAQLADLRNQLPESLCVEMEGAAVAQVCHEHHTPFLVIRSISDKADHSSPVDFSTFVQETAGRYTRLLIQSLL